MYRAGLVVPAVALLIALVGLHAPAGIDLAPDAPPTFNADRALTLAGRIADVPDRTAGSETAPLAATVVAQAFTDVGAQPQVDTFTATARNGRTATMRNIVTVLRGESNEAIVVFAHRDNVPPGADAANSALGTAVVVELAAAFADQRNARTLVLASVDGGQAGDAGARRLATHLPRGLNPVAAIAVQGIAPPGPIPVADRGDGRDRAAAGFAEGVADVLAAAGGGGIARPNFLHELSDLIAPPRTPGGQAPFIARGMPAITIGEDPRQPADSAPDVDRFARTSQAVNDLVLAIDAGSSPSGPSGSYVRAGRRVLSGWVIALLAVALLVPPGLVAVDLTGRAMRERLPLRDELLRISRVAIPLSGAALGALVAGATGAAPSSPSAYPFGGQGSGVGLGAALIVLAGTALGVAASWLVPPPPRVPAGDPAVRAVVAVTAALLFGCAGAGLAIAALPAAGVLLVPALHVWAMLERVTRGGPVVRALAILLPLVLPAVAVGRGAGLDAGEAVRLISDGRMPIGAAIGAALTLAAAGILAARFIVPQRPVA
ncbi:MAG: Peptidase family [Gaiellaceae bacterium]|nr:Peptidase family [Gaiellaceae bacterium]